MVKQSRVLCGFKMTRCHWVWRRIRLDWIKGYCETLARASGVPVLFHFTGIIPSDEDIFALIVAERTKDKALCRQTAPCLQPRRTRPHRKTQGKVYCPYTVPHHTAAWLTHPPLPALLYSCQLSYLAHVCPLWPCMASPLPPSFPPAHLCSSPLPPSPPAPAAFVTL